MFETLPKLQYSLGFIVIFKRKKKPLDFLFFFFNKPTKNHDRRRRRRPTLGTNPQTPTIETTPTLGTNPQITKMILVWVQRKESLRSNHCRWWQWWSEEEPRRIGYGCSEGRRDDVSLLRCCNDGQRDEHQIGPPPIVAMMVRGRGDDASLLLLLGSKD